MIEEITEENINRVGEGTKSQTRKIFKAISALIVLFILIVLSFELTSFSYSDNNTNIFSAFIEDDSVAPYIARAPKIPDLLLFAGDTVPVHFFDVRESLDREILVNMYWHSATFQSLKRAGRYFPIIEPILKKNGIPDDFKYLAVAESGLRNAVSPAGASGVWQFMKATAKGYNIEVNLDIDERYNIEKATQAACQYLKRSYKRFNDWALVAAAYNAGSGGVGGQLKKQKVKSYYDLHLNSETARYTYRIIAIKLIMSNPKAYGFIFDTNDLYKPISTYKIEVDTTINDLVNFAKYNSISYDMLKKLNPWLRSDKLPNKSKKKYQILIPKKGFRSIKNN